MLVGEGVEDTIVFLFLMIEATVGMRDRRSGSFVGIVEFVN